MAAGSAGTPWARSPHRLRPSPVGIGLLWLSAVLMAVVGGYQVVKVLTTNW